MKAEGDKLFFMACLERAATGLPKYEAIPTCGTPQHDNFTTSIQ
jgi:hypothetical protein